MTNLILILIILINNTYNKIFELSVIMNILLLIGYHLITFA